jgi:hypothetical protein
MPDKVLVSVASHGRENYNSAQLNLITSSLGKWDGDYIIRSVDGYVDEYKGVKIQKGWPNTVTYGQSWQHSDNPYQFKPFAIQEAIEVGYKKILWCDSTIRLMKIPNWELAEKYGICAWDNEGHPLKEWITNYQLEYAGLQNASGIKQIMACCIMFDFDHPKTKIVFDRWIQGSIDNCFHKSTENGQPSRHDQSLLSALMYVNGIEVQPYGELAYPYYTPIKPTFLNYGVG